MSTQKYKHLYTNTYINFVKYPYWKHPKYPLIGEWVDKFGISMQWNTAAIRNEHNDMCNSIDKFLLC